MMEHTIIRRRLEALDVAIQALTEGWGSTCESGPISVWSDRLAGTPPEEADAEDGITTAVTVMVLRDIREQLVTMGRQVESYAAKHGPVEWTQGMGRFTEPAA